MANLEILKQEGCDPQHFTWSRRSFAGLAGWGVVLGSIGAGTLAFGRFMYPRVLFEPNSQVKIGRPDDYNPNKIDERWIEKYRFWVIRTNDHIMALSGKCTHLGCTPRFLEAEDKFKCPCHGSGFRGIQGAGGVGVAGINFEGPAPRPLERFKVSLAEDGQILVDWSKLFRFEKDEWEHPEASIKYVG